MVVAAMQGADQHIRSRLGFSILPKVTLPCRPGETNQRPSNNKMLAQPLSHSRPWIGGGHEHLQFACDKRKYRNVKQNVRESIKQIKSTMKCTTCVTEDSADETSDLRGAMRRLWPSPNQQMKQTEMLHFHHVYYSFPENVKYKLHLDGDVTGSPTQPVIQLYNIFCGSGGGLSSHEKTMRHLNT